GHVALHVGRTLLPFRERAPHSVPGAVANSARRGPLALEQFWLGGDCRACRLRVGGRAQPRFQALGRSRACPLSPRGRRFGFGLSVMWTGRTAILGPPLDP